MDFEYCKIEIFIPPSHFPQLQETLAAVDAGHVGTYDCCLSYSEVRGCWRPLEGSQPYDGVIGQITCGSEYKVEVLCKTASVDQTIRAIKSVHPYETPVINVIPLYRTGLAAE